MNLDEATESVKASEYIPNSKGLSSFLASQTEVRPVLLYQAIRAGLFRDSQSRKLGEQAGECVLLSSWSQISLQH